MSHQNANTDLQFSRAERWLLHAALLNRLGYGPAPSGEPEPCVRDLALVEKLERPESAFSHAELEQLRIACLAHIERPAAHARDRSLALDLVESFDRELNSPTPPDNE